MCNDISQVPRFSFSRGICEANLSRPNDPFSGKGHIVKNPNILQREEQSLDFFFLPKCCFVHCDFHLTEDNSLMPSAKIFL